MYYIRLFHFRVSLRTSSGISNGPNATQHLHYHSKSFVIITVLLHFWTPEGILISPLLPSCCQHLILNWTQGLPHLSISPVEEKQISQLNHQLAHKDALQFVPFHFIEQPLQYSPTASRSIPHEHTACLNQHIVQSKLPSSAYKLFQILLPFLSS